MYCNVCISLILFLLILYFFVVAVIAAVVPSVLLITVLIVVLAVCFYYLCRYESMCMCTFNHFIYTIITLCIIQEYILLLNQLKVILNKI